jgi:hypothetical protein
VRTGPAARKCSDASTIEYLKTEWASTAREENQHQHALFWRWKTQLAAKNFQPALLDGHTRRPEATRPKETSANENCEENQTSRSSRNQSGKSGRAPNPRTGSQAATQVHETRAGTKCVSQNCNRKMSRAGERPGN